MTSPPMRPLRNPRGGCPEDRRFFSHASPLHRLRDTLSPAGGQGRRDPDTARTATRISERGRLRAGVPSDREHPFAGETSVPRGRARGPGTGSRIRGSSSPDFRGRRRPSSLSRRPRERGRPARTRPEAGNGRPAEGPPVCSSGQDACLSGVFRGVRRNRKSLLTR